MPLINCPSCNEQIADDAAHCPHCNALLGKLEWVCKQCEYSEVCPDLTFLGSDRCKEEHICPDDGCEMQPEFTPRNGGKSCPNCGHPYTTETTCSVCGRVFTQLTNDDIRKAQTSRNKYGPENPYPPKGNI